MQILINKNGNEYDLNIESGHFSGILRGITKESLELLESHINNLLNNNNSKIEVIWNPRSRRHEKVNN